MARYRLPIESEESYALTVMWVNKSNSSGVVCTCSLLEQRPGGSGGILISLGDMFLTFSENKAGKETKNMPMSLHSFPTKHQCLSRRVKPSVFFAGGCKQRSKYAVYWITNRERLLHWSQL